MVTYTDVGATTDVYLMKLGEEPQLYERDARGATISPDGQSFLLVEYDRDESARVRIEFILNWARNLPSIGD